MIKKRILRLKKLIIKYNLDGYIVPKNDYYFSEFSSPDRLKAITNFSGSAGFAIIFIKENFLFVDGRYSTQANIECGKKFKIIEIPSQFQKRFLKIKKNKLVLGFDPKLFTSFFLEKSLGKKFDLRPINKNLVDEVVKNKKKIIKTQFYSLSEKITGESIKSKINKLIKLLKKQKIDNIFISAPENVAWLLNLRGEDNPNSPIPNCQLILDKKKQLYFFSNSKKINLIKKIKQYKNLQFIENKNFKNIVQNLKGKNFCIDKLTCSIFNQSIIQSFFNIKSTNDPCYYMKSIKNKSEISHMINSHISDGVALTKFIYWIKKLNKKKITEITAQKKLENLRKLNKNYLYPSFDTIAGTGSNGAIIHYRANKKTNKIIKKKNIFLCDSGGQYKYGTTDVTRTICFSKPKNYIKNIFTKILKGHIAVVTANLSKYSNGKLIDPLARKFLKLKGLDYEHGTGHGVGFFLNVHEGPQAISKFNNIKIHEGMILSNEPGYYKKGKFGIRIENLVYVKKYKKKLMFKNLTLAPIEKDLINYKKLNKKEKEYLFRYHYNVYSKISKFLTKPEKNWLASFI